MAKRSFYRTANAILGKVWRSGTRRCIFRAYPCVCLHYFVVWKRVLYENPI